MTDSSIRQTPDTTPNLQTEQATRPIGPAGRASRAPERDELQTTQQQQQQPATKMEPAGVKVADNFGRTLRSRAARRSLSGVPLTNLFDTKFRHFKAFQAAQRETNGLNSLLVPPPGALYRSSVPVTPISTPLLSSHGLRFTEQALQKRILVASARKEASGQFARPLQEQAMTTAGDISEEPAAESQAAGDFQDFQAKTRLRPIAGGDRNETQQQQAGSRGKPTGRAQKQSARQDEARQEPQGERRANTRKRRS